MEWNAEDTIAAIATPSGEGGVGIVRLSGPQAITIASAFFVSSRGRDIRAARQQVYHGHIVDAAGQPLDEVLLHIMRAPRSYTREDVVEINTHGGPAPLNAVLEEALRRGARLARPGEFTLRAFLNGRIDLVQAEAVIDQIRARTRAGLQAANAAASGTLSQAIHAARDILREALAHIEAAVDFPEEDLPDLVNEALFARLRDAHDRIRELLDTADAGRLVREGAAAVIAGRPNVGKSSLFNALLRDARAIVSAQPGTTRDRLEEYITIAGVPVKLIDTAGIREAGDEVERIGVEIAWQALDTAQLALLVLDATQPPAPEEAQLAKELCAREIPLVLVINKTDCAAAPPENPWPEIRFAAVCPVSATAGAGIKTLESAIAALLLGGAGIDAAQPMITRQHQKDSLRRAEDSLQRLFDARGVSPEFLALELRDALGALGEITGETTPEDILDAIFANFCIGK